MEMSGERQIAAPREEVWAALNDPEVLQACIPGCEEMEKTAEDTFTAKVTQKVGPVRAKFTGEVHLSDIVAGESYTISGSGKGGAAGGASGGAKVRLEDKDGGTLLTYDAEAKVTGKLAQLGARLINGFAKKMADEFFTRFKDRLEEPGAADADADADGDDDLQGRIDKAADDAAAAADKTAGEIAETVGEAAEGAQTRKSWWNRLRGGA